MGKYNKTLSDNCTTVILIDNSGIIQRIIGQKFSDLFQIKNGESIFKIKFFKDLKFTNAFHSVLSGEKKEILINSIQLSNNFYCDITLLQDNNLFSCALIIKKSHQEIPDSVKITRELQQMDEIIRQINSTLQMDEVLDIIFRQLKDFFSFDGMCIQLLDENKKIKTMKIFHEGAGEDDLAEMENLEYDFEFANDSIKRVLIEGIHLVDDNTLFVPLVVRNEITGILSVSYFEEGFSLNDTEINSVKRYAEYIAIALNNSRLYRSIEKINKELQEKDAMISRDLYLAQLIQNKIFVNNALGITNIHFHVDYLPFIEVGGDFYDISKLNIEGTKIRIFIADATGHGIPAGLITMLLKSEYEKTKQNPVSPAATLKKFNHDYSQHYFELGVYCTAFIADLDFEKGTLTFSSAGHPFQILISDDKIHEITTHGALIGLFDDICFNEDSVKIKSGDKILFFTDGIFEEFNSRHEIYGEERLLNCIQSNLNQSVEEIKNAVLQDVRDFTGKHSFEDDLTYIGVEIK